MGRHVITIRAVDVNGRLDAGYVVNPSPLPFCTVEASREGTAIRAVFERRAGGYDGSTCMLAYDPAKDVLRGVYDQAVARWRFDVYFVRAKQP